MTQNTNTLGNPPQLATLCYVRSNGKTLMMCRDSRSEDVHYGKWNGLGGKFNPGETPEACAVREVYEESGLRIYNPRMAGVLTFPDFSHGKDWYVFVFTATIFEGKLVGSSLGDSQEQGRFQEHGSCAEGSLSWVPDEEVLKLSLWDGDKVFLPLIYQEKFFSGMFLYKQGSLHDHHITIY